MMTAPITCLVTLHGVGFEQPPEPGVDNSGYADLFHQHLKAALGNLLSDDPHRARQHPGENGAIYVQSRWLDAQGHASREEGLKRLGRWEGDPPQVAITDAPLVVSGEPVAHIALVYSNLEPTRAEMGAALEAMGMALAHRAQYTSVLGLLHLALADGLALLKHPAQDAQEQVSSCPRTDQRDDHPVTPPGLLTTVIEDVAGYVCYNEQRERVRSFVREALTRLASRPDVAQIVLNTHSNGTVIAFDVLRHLPDAVSRKIKRFVTAGSPLRKYVALFHWGTQLQCSYPFEPWYNFWDPCDPVADPLDPPVSWRAGKAIRLASEKLFSRLDLASEAPCWIPIRDCEVNNVEKSRGGGLRAHNYWDNDEQFVRPLAELLRHPAG